MTDYNDGNWHKWNGGECPVHEKSVVVIQRKMDTRIHADREHDDDVWDAGKWDWTHDNEEGDIIAFRVIKPYREPREFYAYKEERMGYGPDGKRWVQCYPEVEGATLFREVLTD